MLILYSFLIKKTDIGKHPTVNKAIEGFRIEQKNTEIAIAQLNAGDVYRKKKETIDYDQKLREIVLSLNTVDLEAYLDSLTLLL